MKYRGKITVQTTEALKQELAWWAHRQAMRRGKGGLGPAPREYMAQIRRELRRREPDAGWVA